MLLLIEVLICIKNYVSIRICAMIHRKLSVSFVKIVRFVFVEKILFSGNYLGFSWK